MDSSSLLALWGKTGTDDRYHPALFHMIDVGHVASALLSSPAPNRFLRVLGRALGAGEAKDLGDWLPLVVALHDIGKVGLVFQGQVPAQRARLEAAGFPFTPNPLPEMRPRHQQVSALAVAELAPLLQPLVDTGFEVVLRDVLSGHHGRYSTSRELRAFRSYQQVREPAIWRESRLAAGRLLRDVFPLPDLIDATVASPRRATIALTGFVILCDWLGSDTTYFPLSQATSLEEYLPISRQRAWAAVAATGLVAEQRQPLWNGFSAAFPVIDQPRGLQSLVDDLPLAGGPGLYVIEAATGEGKSEVALALAQRVAALGGSAGIYFGLPTTATSNQMYGRVRRFLEDNADPGSGVELIHGQALLARDALLGDEFGNDDDPESPARLAPTWFSPKKRALLAPYGVGTVDQAELCVLSARHYMLRLFGLAGKVVIIDEVHAYDTYMSTVIDHLLTWLASLGTTLMLLSATLPRRRHGEMAEAYLAGIDARDAPPAAANSAPGEDTPPLPYPLMSVYDAGGSARYTPASTSPSRDLAIEFVPDLVPDEEAARLLELVSGGGALARIVNTVQQAQEIYASLRRTAGSDVELYLLHARMPGEDRLSREAALLRRLGPASERDPGECIIVVGTQVLEQSLDYDVDLMVSDFAPLDLLLQRAGREHRHAWRRRPTAFADPVLQITLSTDDAGIPRFGAGGTSGASTFVYEPFILWKSWLALEARRDASGRMALRLPGDYRPLIELTYDDRWEDLAGDDRVQQQLASTWQEYRAGRSRAAAKARGRLVPLPGPVSPITEGTSLTFEEDEDGGATGWGTASTRDGEATIQVIPLYQVAGGVVVTPDGQPLRRSSCDRAEQLKLLRRAMRVSRPELVRLLPELVEADRSISWLRRLPLLANHYPLVLDDGEATIGRLRLRLDPELGLVFQRKETQ